MRDSCLADSPGVQRHSASVNAVHGIDYTSFISLGTMNLTPLINVFSQSIGMILSKTVVVLIAMHMVTNYF